MSLLKSLFCAILALLILAGCSTADKKVDAMADRDAATETDISTSGYTDDSGLSGIEIKGISTDDSAFMEGSLMGSNAELMGGEFADPKHSLSTQIIYFLYDSSRVRADFVKVIAAHSQYLMDNLEQSVVLEGHADERGSAEYNVALSEQRAKSISRIMQSQGVLETQITLVSYGEEKPRELGHNSVAWGLNRRVEIVYQAR